MTDDLRTRIADIVFDHGWNHGACDCGDCTTEPDYLPYDRGCHAAHVADAVIEALEADYVLVPKWHALARIHAAREAAKASDFQGDDDDTECDTTWVAPGEIAKMMGADDE